MVSLPVWERVVFSEACWFDLCLRVSCDRDQEY